MTDVLVSYIWQQRREFDDMKLICGCGWISKWNLAYQLWSPAAPCPWVRMRRVAVQSALCSHQNRLHCDRYQMSKNWLSLRQLTMNDLGLPDFKTHCFANPSRVLVHNEASMYYIINRKWVMSILQLRSEHKATSHWTIIKIFYWTFNKKMVILVGKKMYLPSVNLSL